MSRKILIIDDDPRNLFALSAVLKSKGYMCVCVTGMREALETLGDKTDVGIILMDMMMPEMDGYEAIPIIRNMEHLAHIPVIAVTAQAMLGDREKCLAAGADDYLSKPVDIDELLKLLNQYLK